MTQACARDAGLACGMSFFDGDCHIDLRAEITTDITGERPPMRKPSPADKKKREKNIASG